MCVKNLAHAFYWKVFSEQERFSWSLLTKTLQTLVAHLLVTVENSSLICFWYFALTFKAGSVHVRVRRDADEQMVLSHVYHRLANLISVLTVQIFKDDWSRPTAFQILGDTSLLSKPVEAVAPQGVPLPVAPSYAPPQFPSYIRGPQPTVPARMTSYGQYGPTGVFKDGLPRTTLAPHVGVRFPPIPHYTDAASGSQIKYGGVTSGATSVSPAADFSVPDLSSSANFARDHTDKHK
jgi:hypothetical protein